MRRSCMEEATGLLQAINRLEYLKAHTEWEFHTGWGLEVNRNIQRGLGEGLGTVEMSGEQAIVSAQSEHDAHGAVSHNGREDVSVVDTLELLEPFDSQSRAKAGLGVEFVFVNPLGRQKIHAGHDWDHFPGIVFIDGGDFFFLSSIPRLEAKPRGGQSVVARP